MNSIVLYIAPQGRIAYWADWRFWGLTKTEWANQHIIIGVLFLLAILLHIYYNWKPIVAYLKNKARQLKIFTREFNIALIFVIVCTIGAYVDVAPFNWVLDFSESIKEPAAKEYGNPPYGRTELSSLKTFTSKVGLELTGSIERLKKAGIRLEDGQHTLLKIAKVNKISPQQLYLTMKPSRQDTGTAGLPDVPKAGLGKLTLSDLCQEYQLNLSEVMKMLKEKKITVSPTMKIKEIAEQSDLKPTELYETIKKSVGEKKQ